MQDGGEEGASAVVPRAQGSRAAGQRQRQPQEVGEQRRGERRQAEVSCFPTPTHNTDFFQ